MDSAEIKIKTEADAPEQASKRTTRTLTFTLAEWLKVSAPFRPSLKPTSPEPKTTPEN